jgi:poly-gamma-glutamate synthesis protein (capsule biosynthesis protein)
MIDLVIGGDVCPINANEPLFKSGNARAIFSGLCEEFSKADLSVINLECPLVDADSPILKDGPNLRASTHCVAGIAAAGIDVINLANNHIMDQGPQGLESTLKACKDGRLSTVGADKNLEAARQIFTRQIGRVTIGILGVAEHDFPIAAKDSWGVYPLDLPDLVLNLTSNSDDIDYLVVLLHGGNEHYPYPSPRIKTICHFLADMGADAVVVQHTHCPGCYEYYKNTHIVYGQGNLIFDLPGKKRHFYQGVLIHFEIDEDLSSKIDMVPYVQSDGRAGAQKMEDPAGRLLLGEITLRSSHVNDDDFLCEKWIEFCRSKGDGYRRRLLKHSLMLRILNKTGIFSKLFRSEEFICRVQNMISCESHRDVLLTVLNQRRNHSYP